jgi:hypothetical protein
MSSILPGWHRSEYGWISLRTRRRSLPGAARQQNVLRIAVALVRYTARVDASRTRCFDIFTSSGLAPLAASLDTVLGEQPRAPSTVPRRHPADESLLLRGVERGLYGDRPRPGAKCFEHAQTHRIRQGSQRQVVSHH